MGEAFDAAVAEVRVLARRPPTELPHELAANPGKGSVTHPAAGWARHCFEEQAEAPEGGMAIGKHLPEPGVPLRLVGLRAHPYFVGTAAGAGQATAVRTAASSAAAPRLMRIESDVSITILKPS